MQTEDDLKRALYTLCDAAEIVEDSLYLSWLAARQAGFPPIYPDFEIDPARAALVDRFVHQLPGETVGQLMGPYPDLWFDAVRRAKEFRDDYHPFTTLLSRLYGRLEDLVCLLHFLRDGGLDAFRDALNVMIHDWEEEDGTARQTLDALERLASILDASPGEPVHQLPDSH